MTLRSHVPTLALCLVVTAGGLARAGDLYWSPVSGLADVNDFAVCGTTVYAATDGGLYRSDGDPAQWHVVRPAGSTLVACSASRVIWEEIVGLSSVVYVSHDALQTVVAANGLDDAISRGLKDLSIAGDTALVATLWGVDRSTDGGLNFPAAYPVLWESSAGYQITAVWTDGTACAAAGTGGFAGQGIWYTATGAQYSWNRVLDVGGQAWLDGSGSNTIVSGSLYADPLDSGYVSTDGGASWTALPLSWGGIDGHYQRPFVSDTRILSRHVYEEFDPGSGQFITRTNGPYFYDMNGSYGNDLDAGLPTEEEILNQAIVEGADPYLLVALRDGGVWWFRSPGGWPPAGFDMTPPFSPSINTSPRIGTTPPITGISLAPFAVDAAHMYLEEVHYSVAGYVAAGTYYWWLFGQLGPTTDGWQPYATSVPWDVDPGTGTHTVYAWFGDAAGNMTDPAVQSATTTFPQSLVLPESGSWGALMYARAGESFTIGGVGSSGDIDVDHWEPGSVWSDDWAASYSNDTLSFVADSTGYHLILIYNYPGAGVFDGSIVAQTGVEIRPNEGLRTKPPLSMDGDPLPNDPPPYHQSAAATLIFGDGFESGDTGQWSQ